MLFKEVSAKTGDGIEEAFTIFAKTLLSYYFFKLQNLKFLKF